MVGVVLVEDVAVVVVVSCVTASVRSEVDGEVGVVVVVGSGCCCLLGDSFCA